MRELPEHLLDYPRIQLDPAQLDVVELVLGGLLDPSDLDMGFLSPGSGLRTGEEPAGQHLVLADPDGTALALVCYAPQQSPVSGSERRYTATAIEPLAMAEHGAFRDLRVCSSIGDSPAVLFNRPPTAKQIRTLHQQLHVPVGTHFVLVRTSSTSHGPEHAEAMEQLQAAASLFEGITASHLVLPDRVASGPVIDRLSSRIIADFRDYGATAERQYPGLVVMFSGLSGSGKSTLARAVQQRIHQDHARHAVVLDGDDIRRFVSKGLGFSRADRETNVERIGWIAARIAEVGGIALCAPIAPFDSTRQGVRSLSEQVGQFFLIHVSTPLEVCEQRDRKGLYAKARAGLVKDFTGIDSPYEVPQDADLSLDLSAQGIGQASGKVMDLLFPQSR